MARGEGRSARDAASRLALADCLGSRFPLRNPARGVGVLPAEGFSPVRCTCHIDGRSRRAHCPWFSRGRTARPPRRADQPRRPRHDREPGPADRERLSPRSGVSPCDHEVVPERWRTVDQPGASTATEETAHGVDAPAGDVLAKRPDWQAGRRVWERGRHGPAHTVRSLRSRNRRNTHSLESLHPDALLNPIRSCLPRIDHTAPQTSQARTRSRTDIRHGTEIERGTTSKETDGIRPDPGGRRQESGR